MPTNLNPIRVLVVDDYAESRRLYAQFLQASAVDVDTADDGPAALEHVRRTKPDVLVLDLCLPQLDGWQVMRQLKSDPRTQDVKIIALTGRTGSDETSKALNAGFDAFLQKPIWPQQLLSTIHAVLLRRAPESARAAVGDSESRGWQRISNDSLTKRGDRGGD